jgi:hypothetical protein
MVPAQLRWSAIALLGIAFQSAAADSVRITYRSGYPLPGLSSEASEVVVDRPTTWPESRAEVDLYFLSVVDLANQIAQQPDCGAMPLHTPTVTIQVQVGALALSRVCPYSLTGVPSRIGATADELAHNAAFERLLALTIQRTRALFRK